MKDYPINSEHNCIVEFEDTPDDENWVKCPRCGLRPKVWRYNNGMHTACGCWFNKYQHLDINSESVNSVYKRTGNTKEYDGDGLRKNWNHWCETGEALFQKGQYKETGRW